MLQLGFLRANKAAAIERLSKRMDNAEANIENVLENIIKNGNKLEHTLNTLETT